MTSSAICLCFVVFSLLFLDLQSHGNALNTYAGVRCCSCGYEKYRFKHFIAWIWIKCEWYRKSKATSIICFSFFKVDDSFSLFVCKEMWLVAVILCTFRSSSRNFKMIIFSLRSIGRTFLRYVVVVVVFVSSSSLYTSCTWFGSVHSFWQVPMWYRNSLCLIAITCNMNKTDVKVHISSAAQRYVRVLCASWFAFALL